MRYLMPVPIIAAALSASFPAPAASLAPPAGAAQSARFQAFFQAFRKAVLAGDRNAVAGMTHFPFRDFREGHYCEAGEKGCTASPDTATSRDHAEFLRRYDRIFTPAVVAAVRANRIRGYRPEEDGGEAPGPITRGEYLLDAPDVGDQRVFVPVGGTWKLDRVPFYS